MHDGMHSKTRVREILDNAARKEKMQEAIESRATRSSSRIQYQEEPQLPPTATGITTTFFLSTLF